MIRGVNPQLDPDAGDSAATATPSGRRAPLHVPAASLPNVVSPPALRYFANEPFADLHRVEGLRGVFVATLVNGSVSEDNMRSVITFDKGGTWELLQAPAADSLGGTVDCQVEARRAAAN